MAKLLFNHVSVGDGYGHMSDIRKDHINMVVARNIIHPDTIAYLGDIDFRVQFRSDWDEAPSSNEGCMKNCSACSLSKSEGEGRVYIRPARFENINPHEPEAMEKLRVGLRKFPQGPSINAFADDVLAALKTFASATGTEKVESFIMAKYPVPGALWHRDNDTNYRALITFFGPGTYWRPNDTMTDADWAQQTEKDELGRFSKGFGRFGREFMDKAQQVERASMALWKGDHHARPLVHAEPTSDVADRGEMRLVMHMDIAP